MEVSIFIPLSFIKELITHFQLQVGVSEKCDFSICTTSLHFYKLNTLLRIYKNNKSGLRLIKLSNKNLKSICYYEQKSSKYNFTKYAYAQISKPLLYTVKMISV